MTNQERSIFHSSGMPLRFSENAGVSHVQPSGWMSPFAIIERPQTMPQGAGVASSPALDGPVDQEEYAREVPDERERGAVPGEGPGLPAGQVTQPPLPSSFSWPSQPHYKGFQLSSAAKPGEPMGRSNQNSAWANLAEHQESSPGSIATDFSETGQRRLPTPNNEAAAAGAPALAGFLASPVKPEIRPREESRNAAIGKSAAHSSDDSPAASAEPRDDRQSRGINAPESPVAKSSSAPVANSSSRWPSVKVTTWPRSSDAEKASSRSTSHAGHNRITQVFAEQKLRPEVLTTTAAAKADALEVLEKLSSGGSQAPASPAPGRRVHIGKLHITVQRPAIEAPPQSLVAGAQRASQPVEHTFFNPWERHYSSFD